jgi:hypothetical protein
VDENLRTVSLSQESGSTILRSGMDGLAVKQICVKTEPLFQERGFEVKLESWGGETGLGDQIFFIIISGVGLSPLGTAASSGLLYKPQMIDEGDCGAIGVMKIGRGNRSTRRKPATAPLCPPQIPHDQTRVRTPGRRDGKPATYRLSYGAALGDQINKHAALKKC